MSADFTPEKEDYKILTPFKMQVLTNFPYIEADFDALTNYQLLCKVVEYLNNVIANENEVTEQVTSLYNAYVSLQNYVNTEIGDFETTVNNRVDGLESYMDNYFNNLDVQQEINNKLDAMALDGSLTNLISGYVDPIYQAYETEINNDIYNFKNTVNSNISTINAKVDAATSGSPAGVYSTVSALTSADPDHTKIYVVTEDGKWYYYNGAAWTAGGTYQSTGIGTNTVGEAELTEDLQDILEISIPTLTVAETGKYINNIGQVVTAVGFSYTTPIEIKKNETFKYLAKGFLTNVSMISSCDSLGDNIVARTISTDSNVNEYSYTATEDSYIILSYDASTTPSNISISNHIENISDRVEDIEDKFNVPIPEYTLTNEYIRNDGVIMSASNFRTSSAFQIKAGQKITINAKGYLTIVSMITETQSNGTVISPLVTSIDSEYHDYTYQALRDMYIRISYLQDNTTTLNSITIKNDIPTISQVLNSEYNAIVQNTTDINEIKYTNKNNILSMFSNLTCIGDSLTYSQVYTSASTSRQAYETYPEILTKITGTTSRNLAIGGYTPTSWWNHFEEDIEEKTNQITLIYLGTNGTLTDTVDTDCAGNDYTQYANTETGNFGKIIKKSLDVGSKVILIKCYENVNTFDTNNEVIGKLATKFSVPIIHNNRFTEDLYHYYPDLTGTNYIHYNDLGYNKFANYINNSINNLSNDDLKTILPV